MFLRRKTTKKIARLSSTVVLWSVGLGFNCPLAGEKPSKCLWSIHLSEDQHYSQFVPGGSPITGGQIAFISQTRLALSFLTPKADTTQSESGVLLVCLLVRTDNQQIERVLIWRTPFKKNYLPPNRLVMPGTGGEFLVYTGESLLRYDSSLNLVQERHFADAVRTRIVLSPNHNQLFVSEFVSVGKFREFMVSTQDLDKETKLGIATGAASVGMNDVGDVLKLAFNPSQKTTRVCQQSLLPQHRETPVDCGPLQLVHGQTLSLCASNERCEVLYTHISGQRASFVTNDDILVGTDLNGFALINREGATLYEGRLSDVKSETFGPHVSVDADARRFSFHSGYLELNPSGAPTWVGRVRVFDLRSMKPIFLLTFEKSGDNALSSFDQSISPDGNGVAVLKGDELEFYQVPQDSN
jgi:hypothetical protein